MRDGMRWKRNEKNPQNSFSESSCQICKNRKPLEPDMVKTKEMAEGIMDRQTNMIKQGKNRNEISRK